MVGKRAFVGTKGEGTGEQLPTKCVK